jgi:ribosome biogenesis GTPase
MTSGPTAFAPLRPYGWSDRWAALLNELPDAPTPGRIVRHDGASLLVARPDGVVNAMLSHRLDPEPVVGDWIALRGDEPIAVLPRASLLRRRSAVGDSEQPLAANIDVVLLVCGVDRPIKAGRIQRAASLAWDAGAEPVIVLTKTARLDPAAALDEIVDDLLVANPGLDVVTTSVQEGIGLEPLAAIVVDRTVTLLGESGAGKSSIVNALMGSEAAAVGRVRQGDAKGRHTTTTRELFVLPTGGIIVDTPGIRSVGLWVDPDAVDQAFTDIDDLSVDCRFTDCRHDTEPDCAVLAAVADGALARQRLDAWLSLRREAEAAALRATPHELRKRNKQFGRVGKEAQIRKGKERDPGQ